MNRIVQNENVQNKILIFSFVFNILHYVITLNSDCQFDSIHVN